MEGKKSLQASALICQFSDSVQHEIHNLFPYGVMSPRVIVSSIFFSSNKLLRMKKLSVRASSDFI